MGLDVEWALRWVRLAAKEVHEQREELSRLDAAIGDGDHGDNLDRGLSAAVASMEETQPSTPGAVLAGVAAVLVRTVGGASGPLLGTALVRGARQLEAEGAVSLSSQQAAALLRTMADAVALRGHAGSGDKTMLDAWLPAAQAAAQAAESGMSPADVLARAAAAARSGAQETLPMRARRGRASYLGERSRGHLDPGACSAALLLEAAAQAARG